MKISHEFWSKALSILYYEKNVIPVFQGKFPKGQEKGIYLKLVEQNSASLSFFRRKFQVKHKKELFLKKKGGTFFKL